MRQPAGATRRQEGSAMRGRREAMRQPAGGQDDERVAQLIGRQEAMVAGRRDERRQNLVVVRLQTESIGEVAAMVIARIECKPERLCVGDKSQHLSDVVQHGLAGNVAVLDVVRSWF